MKKLLLSVCAFSLAVLMQVPTLAEETVVEKTKEVAADTGKAVKKGARAVKDKTCEMINGKMECLAKKVKHKAQNAGDEISDKVDDVKK